MNTMYRLYNLNLQTPFPCRMLTPAPEGASADVTLSYGDVPGFLSAPLVEGVNWQAAPGQFLFRGGRFSGRFLVEGGTQITLERNPAAQEAKLCAHLLAAVFAALLRQRGLLVLHANVALTPQGAVAITGDTGAGKSTTQAVLLTHGCQVLTDDITVLAEGYNGSIMVLPGVPKINLCEDAAARLGHNVTELQRNPLRRVKVYVPLDPRDTLSEPLPLKGIYHLCAPAGSKVCATPVTGAEKFALLQECIYGPLFPEEHHGLFGLVSAVARQVELIQITRPKGRWSAEEVAEVLLHG